MSRWPDPAERFWSYVRTARPDECWIWGGPVDSKGYGQLTWNGRLQLATRVMLKLHGHSFQPGECALHRCDNPPCVNPAHLWVGTKLDNSDDMRAKRRDRKATGSANGSRKHPQRRPRGSAHRGSKLDEAQVDRIRRDTRPGHVIAAEVGVDRSQVNRIRRGESWRHVRTE